MPGCPTSRHKAIAIKAGIAVKQALQNSTAATLGAVLCPQERLNVGAAACTIP